MSNNTIKTNTEFNYNNKEEIEIDLRELILAIWAGKWIVVSITFLFITVFVVYALNQPNIYKSEALLAPVEQEQSLGALQGQLGGLASLAGINLGGSPNSKNQLAIEVLKSRYFTSEFIQKHNILPDLMAAVHWNAIDNSIIYDAELYNVEEARWIREVSPPLLAEPSMQEAYAEFSKRIYISKDKDTGMIKLAVEHISPFVAQKWVNWLIEDINQTMKIRDVVEAKESTVFLTTQIEQTKITDIQDVLYKLVEEQTKTIMFANVRDEYVFKTIDPAFIPEEKSGPKRAMICILGAIIGGMLSFMIVIVRHFARR